MERHFLVILMIMLIALIPSAKTSPGSTEVTTAEAGSDEPAKVPLTVFLFDKCGGCGVDSPGCGDCEDTAEYHGIIKGQLGNRLYDGTIDYAMYNCRMEANDRKYEALFKAFKVDASLYGHLPIVFIGVPGNGVYLVGEEMLPIVGQTMDSYQAGKATKDIQAEVEAYRAKAEQQKQAAVNAQRVK